MKNTVTLLLAKIFEKGIMFLFFILLAQTFGKEVFGEFSYYFTIASILFVIFDLGGEFYQIREFSKQERLRSFNTIFIIKTSIFFIIFSLTYVINNNLYLLLLLLAYYLDSIISIFRSSMYRNGHYILESKFTIIEKSIFILIVITNIFTIQNIIIMYLAFLISKFLYLLILSNKFYGLRYILKSKQLFDFNFAKYYLFNSWSYILHALLVVVFVQIDIIMLKQMGISFANIGLYSAAVKIYMTVIIFADVLFKQYYPIVSKFVHNNNETSLKDLILKVQNTNLFFSIYFAILTMLFANEIIHFAFGDEFIESSKMLVLLSSIILFRFSMYTYTAILSSSNLNYIKLYTSLTCVVVNIGLNYLLIPKYGVYGALIATIFTEFTLVVLFKISSFKIVFTNYFSMKEFLTLLIGIGSMLSIYIYQPTIYAKSLIFITILISLLLNRENIAKMLTFKGVVYVKNQKKNH